MNNEIKTAARMRDNSKGNERRRALIMATESLVDVDLTCIKSDARDGYFCWIHQCGATSREVTGGTFPSREGAVTEAMQMAVACWGNVNVVIED